MKITHLLIAAVALTSTVAAAQSKKYPPVATDKDRIAEQRSRLWDNTLHPERRTYEELVDHARPVMAPDPNGRPLEASVRQAIGELDKAVALAPKRAEAYALRGAGYAKLADWAKCADDLEAAAARAPAVDSDDKRTPQQRADARRDLGSCEARAGRYNAAEITLARATQLGSHDWVTWMLLGETRIAEGKLDEAIAALTAATELDYQINNSTLHWLLAAAYDRALMPSQAAEQLQAAYRNDRYFGMIKNPVPANGGPFLGDDEADYLLGLAWGVQPDAYAGTSRPELQLAYFRRFLARAKTSPWRRRAQEHVKELAAVAYPEAIERRYSAPLDLEEARKDIKRAMPAMRACIGAADVVLKVTVTRTGPRAPQPAFHTSDPFQDRVRMRPVIAPAAPGTSIVQDEQFAPDASRTAIDAAIRCIEPIADKLVLPPVKEKDTSYAVVFSVVGP